MGAIPCRLGSIHGRSAVLFTLLILGNLTGVITTGRHSFVDPVRAAAPLLEAPVVWFENDRVPIRLPKERDPGLTVSSVKATVLRPTDRFFDFSRIARRVGSWFSASEIPHQAANFNSLGEVPNSTWFTNRIGLYPWSAEQAATGPGATGPDRSRPWQITGAKVGGVTPGFQIEDARGDRYLIKFDPPGFVGTTIRAGVIANLVLYSCGYNVPQDKVVTFTRQDLVLGEGAEIKLPEGKEVALTAANLDSLLGPPHDDQGRWHALASKFLPGRLVGPFAWIGRRSDDPNDTVDHQQRRELRGLKMICAFLNHFDSKEQNTLDVYVGEADNGYLVHYLIDFASTLGAGGRGPTRKWGYEYGVDMPAMTGRTLALGFHRDKWTRLERPQGLDEIGYLDNRFFQADEWKPYIPNTTFADLTRNDGYWAAKILTAFRSDHLVAIVEEAHYQNPAAAEYMVLALEQRRDIIGRFWFDRVAPLDFFTRDADRILFHDLGRERDLYPDESTRYRVRWSVVRSDRVAAGWSEWQQLVETAVRIPAGGLEGISRGTSSASAVVAHDTDEYPFLALECQVDRGLGWSKSVFAYLGRRSGRVVAVDR